LRVLNELELKFVELQFPVLKEAFTAFDNEKKGAISLDIIGTILEMLGHAVEEEELDDIIDE
jgi:calmodulin